MTALMLAWNVETATADLSLATGQPDAALRTAIVISLFTDRRAAEDDVLPEADGDRRGWWADAVPAVEGDLIGSRLWLLARGKRTAETVRLARDYALEALAWLLSDGIAGSLDVQSEARGDNAIALAVIITRPNGPARQRFDFLWEPV